MITSKIVLFPDTFLQDPRCLSATPGSVTEWGHLFLTAWREFPGAVGVAAPQLGIAVNMFLWDAKRKVYSKSKKRNYGAPEFVLNPKIVESDEGDELPSQAEGCLSCPGKVAVVPRSHRIVVEYTTEQGKQRKRELEGWEARVFLHEFDHLKGALITDWIKH